MLPSSAIARRFRGRTPLRLASDTARPRVCAGETRLMRVSDVRELRGSVACANGLHAQPTARSPPSMCRPCCEFSVQRVIGNVDKSEVGGHRRVGCADACAVYRQVGGRQTAGIGR